MTDVTYRTPLWRGRPKVIGLYLAEAYLLSMRFEPSKTAIQQHVVGNLQTARYEERRAGGYLRVHEAPIFAFTIERS